HPSFG
ncbi:unnamed protein product, partial [Allacma fusca]